MPSDHVIDPERIHHEWDLDVAPILTIDSGDTVHFDIKVAGEGQVWPGATFSEATFDISTIYNLSGPITVAGAEPGDTLQIEMLSIEHGDWGWAAIFPELGLLPEDFPEGRVRTFDLKGTDAAALVPGVEIPLAPFLGTLGNHPGGARRQHPLPPHRGCGNIDNRHLTEGSTLWIPVHVDGAMFSCGDPHAVQGDGEVCVTALEAPLRCTLRFTLLKRSIAAPSFRVPAPSTSGKDTDGYHATMGISPDLMEGAKIAVRAMIAWLGDEHGIDPSDAYFLCSLAGDLRIIEIVDAEVYNVAMTMPLSVFVDER